MVERRLDQDLDRIRQSLLKMGGMVEGMVSKATQALLERKTELSREVIASDRAVDQLEIEIDELCHNVLAMKQPTAGDLRLLVAVMKINSDLERIGDSAVNIAQSVEQLNDQPPLKPYIDLPRMSQLVQAMVRQSLDAFVRKDAPLATEVCKADDAVDGLYKQNTTAPSATTTPSTPTARSACASSSDRSTGPPATCRLPWPRWCPPS